MAKQDAKVELFYDSTWHDVTFDEEVYTRNPIEITRGRADEVGTTPPAAASFTLANPAGKYNPRSPTSPLFGVARNLPARISVDGDSRFYGEAAAWKPGRPIKGPAWTDVTCAGILRRLSQGSPPIQSAVYRATTRDSTVVGYWPLEEVPAGGSAVIVAGVGPDGKMQVTGAGTAVVTPLRWSDETTLPGSRPLPTLYTEQGIAGVTAAITVTPGPALGIMFWTRTAVPESTSNSLFTEMRVGLRLDGGSASEYRVWISSYPPGTDVVDATTGAVANEVSVYTSTLVGGFVDDEVSVVAPFVDGWRHVYARLSQNGANVDVSIRLDGVEVATGSWSSVTLATASAMNSAVVSVDSAASNQQVDPISAGHITVMAGTTGDLDTAAADAYSAGRGWLGETTGNRFTRLCTEEGITSSVVGDADDTPEMGPQLPDTVANLLREVEATDGGFVFDGRDDRELVMRTGRSLYNQDSVLELNWDAFHVAPPSDPVTDDLNTRNDVTATRRNGASVRAVRESGPLNVADPTDDPEGVGRYAHQVDVNPFSDLVVGNYANWHLHRGTVDEERWPAVTVDLDATADLVADASTIEVGDRIAITNPPAEMTPDAVSLVVLGYTETIGSHRRRITYTCGPESPYHVSEVEHANYSLVGSDGSTVNTAFAAGTGTSLSVAIAAGYPLWSFTSTFDILVSGVRLRVTAIAGASSPQTFTVQAAPINGVVKTLAVGDKVDLFHKSYVGL